MAESGGFAPVGWDEDQSRSSEGEENGIGSAGSADPVYWKHGCDRPADVMLDRAEARLGSVEGWLACDEQEEVLKMISAAVVVVVLDVVPDVDAKVGASLERLTSGQPVSIIYVKPRSEARCAATMCSSG
jgi:hypothetical protein